MKYALISLVKIGPYYSFQHIFYGMTEDARQSIPISGKLDDRDNISKTPHNFEDLPEELQKILTDRKKGRKGSRSALEKLEGKHMLSILVYLDKMSPVMKTDVYNDVARCSNMNDKFRDLEEMGLIVIYRTVRTNSNVVMITDKGRRVAALLGDIADVVNDVSEGGGD